MTETNAERLDRIKNINDLKHVVALGNPTDDGCHPEAINIEREIDWLIEQAERAQELEKTNKKNYWIASDFKYENLKLEQENKRLHEALEELRNRAMNVSPEREDDGSIIEDSESRFLYEFCESVLRGEPIEPTRKAP